MLGLAWVNMLYLSPGSEVWFSPNQRNPQVLGIEMDAGKTTQNKTKHLYTEIKNEKKTKQSRTEISKTLDCSISNLLSI